MYLDFYGFRTEPFHITPDPEFLYLSPSHKEALAAIIYGVHQRKGFITITGEVGLGKTTIVRSYLQRYDRKSIKTVLVFNANVSFKGLLRVIYKELGLEPPDSDPYEMVLDLHRHLIQAYQEGWNVVLIIDEAQNMPMETLENLRMLSNLESTKDKLLQIILIGQPELENLLNRHQLRQLKQRIAIRTQLRPLTPKESLDYIQHRLSLVQREPREYFTRKALDRIVREAQGIPRKINIICDNAFITGFGYGQKTITPKIIEEVVNDLEGRPQETSKGRKRLAAALVGAVVLALAFLWHPEIPRNSWTWLLGNMKHLQGLWAPAASVPGTKEPSPETGGAEKDRPAASETFNDEKTERHRVVKPLPLSEKEPSKDREAAPEPQAPQKTPPPQAPFESDGAEKTPQKSSGTPESQTVKTSPYLSPGSFHGPAVMEKHAWALGHHLWDMTLPPIPGSRDPETVRLSNLKKTHPSRAAPSEEPPHEKTVTPSAPSFPKTPAKPATSDVPQPDPGRVIDWILNKRTQTP
ncbi:MAG: AAA family ATPase [Desulfosoma sp.]